MCSVCNTEPIRVGVLTDEPLRLVGLASIFEERPHGSFAPLSPVMGKIEELLADSELGFVVLDLNSSSGGMSALKSIRRRRPDIRTIVIGPEGNDDLVMELIIAGARAYLDTKASPRIVRQAVDVVIRGSIWAPRRLLSALIDRRFGTPRTNHANSPTSLTDRERQVLELILTARSNREIARKLGIEESTVSAHVGRLMRKTGADNRTDLSMRALNGSILQRVGIENRRQSDRHLSTALSHPPVTHQSTEGVT